MCVLCFDSPPEGVSVCVMVSCGGSEYESLIPATKRTNLVLWGVLHDCAEPRFLYLLE